MSDERYPLKHRRLEQLQEAGFNIADFICFPPQTLRGRVEELRVFLAKHGRISCRHFHQDEKAHFKCPVLYDQTDFEAILAFCLKYNETLYTLCNEALNLQDSVCAGNILTLDARNYFVEFFYGTGTPRDIESKGAGELKVYTRSFGNPPKGPEPPEDIKRVAFEASKFRPVEGPYILEFSLYPYPVGRGQTEVIIWEWRLGWLHYQLQANKFLLEENERLHNKVEELQGETRELRDAVRDLLKEKNEMMVEMVRPRDEFPGLA